MNIAYYEKYIINMRLTFAGRSFIFTSASFQQSLIAIYHHLELIFSITFT